MPKKLVVIDVVGLTAAHIGPHMPHLNQLTQTGSLAHIGPVLPAVTCTAQATYLTGLTPSEHGIVGNGWYFRDQCEVRFWHQSHHLIHGERIWDAMRLRDPNTTCANLFWWYNMYSSVDYSITPRPMYPADGRKLPDIYTQPSEWRDELNDTLGQFPLFNFWGPNASITSTKWITDAALLTLKKYDPTLTLIYLPHLDYALQKFGPNDSAIAAQLQQVDAQVGRIIDAANRLNREIVVLSEYGITPVDQPVHLNRVLRQAGLLKVRTELGREILDAGACDAFAVADHQLAHIYIKNANNIEKVERLIKEQPGVERVLNEETKKEAGLAHPRSGELIAIANKNAWFTYYFWLDDERAPDYAHTVDIHRKPGYDPVELFIDPTFKVPLLAVGSRLIRKKLGFRTLMDVIGTDASLVKGSHGRAASAGEGEGAILISSTKHSQTDIKATDVKSFLLQQMFGG